MMTSAILFTLLLLNVLVLLIYILSFGQNPKDLPKDFKPLTTDEMKKFILWHSVYVNENDPRVWVPKTMGYGKTINFRTKKKAQVFMLLVTSTALIIAAIIISIT